jgi:hypothetical protein
MNLVISDVVDDKEHIFEVDTLRNKEVLYSKNYNFTAQKKTIQSKIWMHTTE